MVELTRKRNLLAQQLYDTLMLISGITPENNALHCDKYNVTYMIRAMLKDEENYHYETTKVLKIVHRALCDGGF